MLLGPGSVYIRVCALPIFLVAVVDNPCRGRRLEPFFVHAHRAIGLGYLQHSGFRLFGGCAVLNLVPVCVGLFFNLAAPNRDKLVIKDIVFRFPGADNTRADLSRPGDLLFSPFELGQVVLGLDFIGVCREFGVSLSALILFHFAIAIGADAFFFVPCNAALAFGGFPEKINGRFVSTAKCYGIFHVVYLSGVGDFPFPLTFIIIQYSSDNVKCSFDLFKVYFTIAILRLQKSTCLSAGASRSRTPTIFRPV